jgi:O-antigen/teichoic acid export membrane protein
MSRTARAFILASIERYASLLINLCSTAILSRLLTPGEFGVVVMGFAATALAEGVRELGGASYVVQARDLDRETLRCAFTISVGLTFLIAPVAYFLADPIARFYQLPQLADFLRVFALGFVLGPTTAPASALMARNLAFARRGAAVLIVATVNAGACIAFAMHGLSYMSFAWAYVLCNAVSTVIYPLLLGDVSMFGVSFRDWRPVLTFGFFGGATRLLNIAGENAAFLVIGRFLSPSGIGLLFRAGTLVTFPERVLLGAAAAVALPVFSDEARKGAPLGDRYVRAVEMLTAIYWPALVGIGLLAYPIVRLFLGPQWHETALYVQIMAGAAMFNASMSLNYPVQVATGAIRMTPFLALFHAGTSLFCLALAAPLGPVAVAWSFWVSVPVNVAASVWLVHRVAPFSLRDLAGRLLRSGGLAVGAALGPLALIAAHGWRFDLPALATALAIGLAGVGWIGALLMTRHPLLAAGLEFFRRARSRLAGD